MDYSFHTRQNKSISKPIPGKRKFMKKNLAGGYAFKATDGVALRRWLLTGSDSNAYYQKKNELTDLNVELLVEMVSKDCELVKDEILYATNFGLNNHAPILALVYLSMGWFQAKKNFVMIFPQVIRTASQLYEFMSYTRALRGMGKVIHKAIKNWLEGKKVEDLEYQFLKYQNRYGFTGRDVLRMIKPVPAEKERSDLYKWIVGKANNDEDYVEIARSGLHKIIVYDTMKNGDKTSESDVINWIRHHKLTHEMIPANITRTKGVWNALFEKMPVGATVRNLGNLTEKGIFDKYENISILKDRFNKSSLGHGKIHPLALLSALKIYQNGGGLGKSTLYWEPNARVSDLLNDAIIDAFDMIEPTGKFFFHAIDISPSMTTKMNSTLWMMACDIAATMALATVKVEDNYFIGGFARSFANLPSITKNTAFYDVMDHNYLRNLDINWSGTDASTVYQYAIDNKMKVDVFCLWTDGESWAGDYPCEVLKEYRRKINPEARAVYITLVPYADKITLVDPDDKKSYDICGFSSENIKLIQTIAKGDL